MSVALFFGIDYIGFDGFKIEDFNFEKTVINLITSFLLQMALSAELLTSVKLMAWVKQQEITH